MICINCQTEMIKFFNKNDFRIKRCPKCNLLAVENIPEDLAPYYREGYFTGDASLDGYMDYEYEKEVGKKSYEKILDKIEKLSGKKGKINLFEVGCATGSFLNQALKRGWGVAGMDISEYAAKEAANKGLCVTSETLEDFDIEKHKGIYDVVCMFDVIEHVRHPDKDLEIIYKILAPGGIFVCLTPDAGSFYARFLGRKWHAFVPPQHLFYFSNSNLSSLLRKAGLKVIYSRHHGKNFNLPYIFRALYSWQKLKIWYWLAKWTSNNFLKKVSLPINLHDTMLVIARKD